ncbi:hypothetical protein TrRE_jg12711 [Triparma retinervis]|uniref:Threonylcarbamoyl-AMP synthase n=1 Tax=Triparma retinervis TaxID=2557542 RepID=A0A9W7DNK6_9STRA|nr:hypothetical protein TrRE_jg12711 [Triparma retinervis]
MNDELVAIPTETVYGLACNALSPTAAERVFQKKARPLTDPLIVHVPSPESALPLISAPPQLHTAFLALTSSFWPGPLTIILPSSPLIPPIITSSTSTVALRSPSHPTCRSIMSACKVPLAMPSANKFGHVSPTTREHVMCEFPTGVLIVDEGESSTSEKVGIESTVVKLSVDPGGATAVQILRPGVVTSRMVSGGMEDVGETVVVDFGGIMEGMEGEALAYRTLSGGGDAGEAGRVVYETLRWAEEVTGAKWIALPDLRRVDDESVEGVKDRIWRAASGIVKGEK